MIRILHTADWQLGKPISRFPDEVILLTCRAKAFRHVTANRILLEGLAA